MENGHHVWGTVIYREFNTNMTLLVEIESFQKSFGNGYTASNSVIILHCCITSSITVNSLSAFINMI